MSSRLPNLAESRAFNKRIRNRALFGDRWNKNGGIGRRGLFYEAIQSGLDAQSVKRLLGRRGHDPADDSLSIPLSRYDDDNRRLGKHHGSLFLSRQGVTRKWGKFGQGTGTR
jgi:hypothetical protein